MHKQSDDCETFKIDANG